METVRFANDRAAMNHALQLAYQGIGFVEPNPAVGAVILDADGTLLGSGWHQAYGGPHAEVHALREAGDRARGATLFVTLEPCAHHGRTPPCADAVIAAGLRRVVVAVPDPAPHTSGAGLTKLREAGIEVEVGLCESTAAELIAPFTKLFTTGRPYVHAKWAMTLDGKIATRTGSSRWISNEKSREVVHEIRGRMDAIVVGTGTALIDDPLLTVRPAGPRTPARVVVDTHARLPLDSQLLRTISDAPVVMAVGPAADATRVEALRQAGVEVISSSLTSEGAIDLATLFDEFGRRRWTNVLVEGGSALLGSCWDAGLVDEVHVFIAPKIVGGSAAVSPLGGQGAAEMPQLASLQQPKIKILEGDVYVHGRVTAVAGLCEAGR